jgi:hypothetical protein
MSAALDTLLGALSGDLRREIRHLQSIEAWAYKQQPFCVGDEVVIARAPSIDKGSGWWSCREFLVEGSTGVIREVYFYGDRWGVLFQPDIQWDASDTFGRRTGDRSASFYFNPARLRKRTEHDAPLAMPADVQPWSHKAVAS